MSQNLSQAEDGSYHVRMGANIKDTLREAATLSLREGKVISFELEGVNVHVRHDSDPELIYRDWMRARQSYIEPNVWPYPSPDLSHEELESDAIIERERQALRHKLIALLDSRDAARNQATLTFSVQLKIVEMIMLITSGTIVPLTEMVEREGRSLLDIARTSDSSVFALMTCKVIEGTADVNGSLIPIHSEPFDLSPWTYIDGEVLSLEEIKKDFPSRRLLIREMQRRGISHAVLTRVGFWYPLEEGESILILNNDSQN